MTLRTILGTASLLAFTLAAQAQPVASVWPVSGPDRTVAVAGSALAGVYASADTDQDQVEVEDLHGTVLRTVTRAEMQALLPWMTLSSSDDGPVAVALSDSGRLLFIAVRDDTTAPDGQPADAILRCEIETGQLSIFLRIELGGSTLSPQPALAHFKSRLYVGTSTDTRVYTAAANTVTGTLIASTPTGASSFAIDRDTGTLYSLNGGASLRRAGLGLSTITYTTLSPSISGATSLAWSDHYGGVNQGGLYIRFASPGGAAGPALKFWSAPNARSAIGSPTTYIADTSATLGAPLGAIATTADGRLLCSGSTAGPQADATLVRDASDTRLSFDAWTADEFAQVVRFAKSLVSPDGEPAGWVIDADVQLGWTRFHPASADGACWVILACLMNDQVNGDPAAQGIVRTILQRYAGRAPDGIRPLRSGDGIYWHWLDPQTGGVKAGWGDGYATLSTMKMVLAAARAVQFYPTDPEIRASAHDIICNVRNWDSYFTTFGPYSMAFLGQATSGPLGAPNASPFHEGIIFTEQASAYGGTNAHNAYNYWKVRTNLPITASLVGKLVTTGAGGGFQAAFVSLYSSLVQADLRNSSDWQTHYRNLRISNSAWTDDNGPKYNTVFSAGTTRSDWGGYNADSLSGHPGDVTTFPSMLAQVAAPGLPGGHVPTAGAAYQAYRRGARQTFLGGASILYRRSQIDQTYQPDSAGLPDVVLGGLGLAELLQPGSVSAVLTGVYPPCASLACRADFNGDGDLNPDDLGDYITCFFTESTTPGSCPRADYNLDGNIDPDDLGDYITAFFIGC